MSGRKLPQLVLLGTCFAMCLGFQSLLVAQEVRVVEGDLRRLQQDMANRRAFDLIAQMNLTARLNRSLLELRQREQQLREALLVNVQSEARRQETQRQKDALAA